MMKITDVKKEILIMEYLDRILMSLKSLILNKNVFLAPKGYVCKKYFNCLLMVFFL